MILVIYILMAMMKKYIYYEQTRTPIYNEDGIWKLGNNIYVCESEE